MKWCKNCNNILIPKDGKLYCKACEEYFELGKNKNDYTISKKIIHDDREKSSRILKKNPREKASISIEDRKAYEEFFTSGEDGAY
ncbi:MAG: DNA-directed RNA polymerase, subunit M/Transcription elongation factor TFIIS [Promethearchaeota archaeon]|nr:MAG: DNA-directed RNA polymerase, subunit M/Transcription elongation factor TFIIS [Candidatus Lokiarchaeota archaeon]